jgi:hypothetical protein
MRATYWQLSEQSEQLEPFSAMGKNQSKKEKGQPISSFS